jgi:adenine-specific DNA-methyltransferase
MIAQQHWSDTMSKMPVYLPFGNTRNANGFFMASTTKLTAEGKPKSQSGFSTPTMLADAARRRINVALEDTRQALGQFLTPAPLAMLMAGLFQIRSSSIRILDPGAGVGTLTAALIERLLAGKFPPPSIEITCYEIDPRLFKELEATLEKCRKHCQSKRVQLAFDIHREDFIKTGAVQGLFSEAEMFDYVVINPPYRKINSQSEARLLLRSVGIETTNLYSGFMLLAARQLAPEGQFVSISPRSFCNGPYFQPFRRELLQLLSLRRLHVFESRTAAFRDDQVLQENIIVYGVRSDCHPRTIEVSVTDSSGTVLCRTVELKQILRPGDDESIIHIATESRGDDASHRMRSLPASLRSLGLAVSTGRVVDFRARDYLRSDSGHGTVPLIYPAHFHIGAIKWPNGNTRKPNAIVSNSDTLDLFVPKGFYVLIKRFSAKEERRRVVAAIYDPNIIKARRAGFDNKTNYIHASGVGLDQRVARGLTIFLNSSVVDEYFRLFSGHTQVNAADLRRMPFPSIDQLQKLSDECEVAADQTEIDTAVAGLF